MNLIKNYVRKEWQAGCVLLCAESNAVCHVSHVAFSQLNAKQSDC